MPLGAFLLYAFVTSVTPGPNNIMSMALGIKYGFVKTLRFNAGVITGFSAIMLLCAFFCAKLHYYLPQIKLPILIAGTVYLLLLAWKVYHTSYDVGEKASEQKQEASYWMGAVLQLVNVKIYFYGIFAMELYILPYFSDPWVLAAFAVFLAAVGTGCNLIWSGFGSAFSAYLAKHAKVVNMLLALSLAYCALSFW